VVLYRALVAMMVSYLVGKIVGSVAHRVIEEDIAAYKRAHPLETDSPGGVNVVENAPTEQPSAGEAAPTRTAA
jgi:hypothetical protein